MAGDILWNIENACIDMDTSIGTGKGGTYANGAFAVSTPTILQVVSMDDLELKKQVLIAFHLLHLARVYLPSDHVSCATCPCILDAE